MGSRFDLIALDIDGTLTNDEKKITPKTLDMLMEAQENGTRLALASARPTPGLYSNCEILRMKEYGGILMPYNGGRVLLADSGETISATTMDIDVSKSILERLERLPVNVIMDDGEIFYVLDKDAYKVDYECWNNNMSCVEVPSLTDALTYEPVKILMSVDPSITHAVQKEIAQELPEDLTVIRTAAYYLEVLPKKTSKGQGLLDVCAHFSIDVNKTAAFGDAENDIPMIRAAGFGVAMSNAEPEVKAVADYVTLSNNDDGVAAALSYAMRKE